MSRRVSAKKQVTEVNTGNKFRRALCPGEIAKEMSAGDHSSPSDDGTQDGITEGISKSHSQNQFYGRPTPSKPLQKREASEIIGQEPEEVISTDFNVEMSKLLEGFGSDMNKSLNAKRRRLEQYTQESMHSTTRLVMETTQAQISERKKLQEEFKRQVFNFLQQGEQEIEKSREAEEKLQKMVQQLSRHQQQMRIAQGQRMKALRQISEQFFGGLDDLDTKHGSQFNNIQADLRKEMALLQKRILMDTQQQEMLNVRKSLKSMLN